MKRYYCPQVHDSMKGWIDLPYLASTAKKKANDEAKKFAENEKRYVRTIRKPKGWTPE